MLRWILGLVMCITMAGLPSGGCGKIEARGDSKKKVVTTFTILQDLAQNIAGDRLVVESITKPGAEIHDYEPTPMDIVKAQRADLVLRNGMGLERWFEKFMGSIRDVPAVDLSEGIAPIGIGEGPYLGKPNPHAWMSPANAMIYVENIRKAFVKLDPEGEAVFNANAEKYVKELQEIDLALRGTLERIPAEQRWLVTSEGAFAYLAKDYGLRELFLWPVNADEEGTPRQIQHVVDTIRANRIPVVFSESTISDKAQRQVASETGAKFGGLLFVDSLTPPEGEAPTYIRLLQVNAETIMKGFGK